MIDAETIAEMAQGLINSGKTTTTVTYAPRGSAGALFANRASELCLVGPAGTGKSRAALEKVHLAGLKYPGARLLMLRKTRRSLTQSAVVTYETKVLHPLDGVRWNATSQEYRYPNKTILALGGLDRPAKVMSSEWDLVYIQEATECTEADIEAVSTRLRNGVMPYQQLIMDVNPDSPEHWLKKRMDAHKTVELPSYHEDNPMLFTGEGIITPEGERYMALLDSLTGVRYLRLRKGLWAAAEGMVYQDVWDRKQNVIPRNVISKKSETLFGDCGIPRDWPRYLSIDFGFVHPFVCHWYAQDPDGRLYMYREIYMSHKLVEDHAATIKKYSCWGKPTGDPIPQKIFSDHDAEDRATLEAHLGLRTTAANKEVSPGIQAVAARYRPAGDGKPRLLYLEDSLVELDRWLLDAKKPVMTLHEIEGYVWDERKEAPIKEDDDGMDCSRMICASLDLRPNQITITEFKLF
jgi:phage terminase large subunit